MTRSIAIAASLVRFLPDPMIVLAPDGTISLANNAALDRLNIKIGDRFLDHCVSGDTTREFLHLASTTTAPVPTRISMRNGHEGVAFGHRLSVEKTKIDGSVMIWFDETTNIATRFAALNADISSLTEKIRHVGEERQHLEDLALTDPLTQVQNRRAFERELNREFSRCTRYKHPMCLTLFDLDRFKSINDTHGHQLGDEILVHFVQRCQEHTRETDILCRYGGEEFALILPETSLEDGTQVVTRMLELVNTIPLVTRTGRISYTTSAGLAALIQADTPESLIARADKNLYAAKNSGRARLVSDLAAVQPKSPLTAAAS